MPDLPRNVDTVGSVPSLAWTTGPEPATFARNKGNGYRLDSGAGLRGADTRQCSFNLFSMSSIARSGCEDKVQIPESYRAALNATEARDLG